MFSSTTCRFLVSVLSLSLSATAETVRGAQRELVVESYITDVNLGTAKNYAILAKTGISTVPQSDITGHIAVSPITGAAITGFGLTTVDGTASYTAATQVTGNVYASDNASPTPGQLITAVSDMETAYNDVAGRANTDAAKNNIGAGTVAGVTLTPGVTTWTSAVSITGNIYFDGSATDIFIIQIAGALLQSANVEMTLLNGVLPENIFWQVAGAVTVGAGAKMKGVILGKTAVSFITGSSLDGRILAQTAVTLQSATITQAPDDGEITI
jgi:hypothetical protein